MPGHQQGVQGKDRLRRIERIRTLTYTALVGLAILLIVGGFGAQGAGLEPFYMPVAAALEMGLIIGFVGALAGILFKHLELRSAPSDNHRFFLVKQSMGRAVWTAGVALAIAIVLLAPVTAPLAGDLASEPPSFFTIPAFATQVVTFTSPDPLGMSFARRVVVVGQGGSMGVVNATVNYGGVPEASAWLNGPERLVFSLDPGLATRFGQWSVVLANVANAPARLTVALQQSLMPALFGSVPFLLILIGSANLGWWILARPVRQRTQPASAPSVAVVRPARARGPYAGYGASPSMGVPIFAPPPPPRVRPSPIPSAAGELRADPTSRPVPPPTPSEPVTAPEPVADSPDRLVREGRDLLASRNTDGALAAFDAALRIQPSSVPALVGRASCLHLAGRRGDAIDTYRRVVSLEPENADVKRDLASLLVEDHRFREALEIVDDMLGRRPHDAALREGRGDVLARLGRRTEAIEAYEVALALSPTNEALKRKLEVARVDVPSLLSRALIASASGRFEQALQLFDEILEVDPESADALVGKAVAYRRSGKLEEASNCLDLVLALQPWNVAALLNRGHILEAQGDLEGALEAFDTLIGLSPLDGEAWAAQGDVLTKMGRHDDALQAYAEALKLNPGDEAIQSKVRELEVAHPLQPEIVQELYKVKGVGPARATALLDAGYRSADAFRRASVDELVTVKGITRKIAEDLIAHFGGEAPVTSDAASL